MTAATSNSTQQTAPVFSTMRHAGQITGVSAATIARWERKGYITLHRVDNRVFVDVDALQAFIRAH